jgi:hypothetical protein
LDRRAFAKEVISNHGRMARALDSLELHPGLPCPTSVHPAGGHPFLNRVQVKNGRDKKDDFEVWQYLRSGSFWEAVPLLEEQPPTGLED